MAETAPICDFGWPAPDFSLPATDGNSYALGDVKGRAGTLVMFICNHCPYVQAILDRIERDARDLADLDVGVVAICSNDSDTYPEDSFEAMAALATERGFQFPYLHDASQQTARTYGAVCTPDFFGFNKDLELQYRGRIDASGRNPAPETARRELYEAMKQIAETGKGPKDQNPSLGCSIKWRA